jgi:signal transduction histidine kinase
MEVYYAIILSSLFFVLLIVILIVAAMSYYREKRTRYEEVNRLNNALLQSQLEIQEQTFRTISEEIHDNIGQVLTMAKLNLDTVDIELKQKASEKIMDAGLLVGKAIKDLRHLSKTLNTETINAIGLIKSIELELLQFQRNGVHVQLDIGGQVAKLDAQKELILFRIVQESLNNIVKHAGATFIRVKAIFTESKFELIISDNGCGFDQTMEDAMGSGLRNMKSRAALIGANLSIVSCNENGTEVNLQLSF